MPRAVSAGMWRSVWLESTPADGDRTALLLDDRRRQRRGHAGRAFPVPGGPIARSTLDGLSLRFRGVCERLTTFEYEWPVEFVAGGCRIPVPGARLWWPKGYGEPNLYHRHRPAVPGRPGAGRTTDHIGIRKLEAAPHRNGRPALVTAAAGRRQWTGGCAARSETATFTLPSTASRSWSRAPTGCRWTPFTAGTRERVERRWPCLMTWAAT